MARMSKLIDTSKCTGCRGCQSACKNWNQLAAEILDFKGFLQTHQATSYKTYTYVDMRERRTGDKMDWFFTKRQCMHCSDAACEKVCPEEAISRTDEGAVIRDFDKCIGCNYCAQYCPFGIPKFNQEQNKMYKCQMCYDRIRNNLKPACASTCPTGAIQFGLRDKMVKEAQNRLKEVRAEYPNANIYGLDDQFLNGINTIYLLLEKPDFYGLEEKPVVPAITSWWKDIIQPMGKVLPLGALGVIGISVFMNRVNQVKREQVKGNGVNGNNVKGNYGKEGM